MALIDDVKSVLQSNGEADVEIQDLIDAAKADLILTGVLYAKTEDETDMLIKRAINLYCKAHFSYDDPKQAERFEIQYESLKTHLTLTSEYTEVAT